jgi:ketosteroid isomerase-like protein
VFSAFELGDVSQMLDLMTDDLVTYRADPDGATFHGKEGFLGATADWTGDFSDWSVIPELSFYVRRGEALEAVGLSE